MNTTNAPAPILIVEDREVDRKYLSTLLRSAGHAVVAAADGDQALALLRSDLRPSLVVSDILMPTVDGYEFVRRMREELGLHDTPVIFYTATYHEREARVLAEQCGVQDVLVKPSPARDILDTVAAVLARPRAAAPAPTPRAEFDHEHLKVIRAALTDATDDLDVSRHRLAALVELSERLTVESDPLARLDEACRAARDVTFSQLAVIGTALDDGPPRLLWRGHAEGQGPGQALEVPVDSELLSAVVDQRRPTRRANPSGRPELLGFPVSYPPVYSMLAVPVATTQRAYGWMCLINKLGATEFSPADQQVATTIGAQAGSAYENARLYTDLLSRTGALEAEVRERRRAEAALRATQERTTFAMAAAGMTVFDVDLATGRLEWSPGAGIVLDGTMGEPPASLADALVRVHADQQDVVRRAVERTMTEGTDFAMELRLVAPDAGSHWVDARAQVIRDERGRPARAIGVVIDVGARRALEAQVHQAQKLEAIGQLAGGLAHDFNNALTAILGYANLISQDLLPEDPRTADLGEIIRAAQGASRLTRQLLAIGRRHVVQLTIVDINQVASDTVAMLRRLLPETIELSVALEPRPLMVRSDPGLLEQVLLNLALNARDAMPDGGALRIETSSVRGSRDGADGEPQLRDGAFAKLSISDTGSGMSDEVKRRLFEPFFSTKAHGHGSGLGLASVHGIVRQSHGHIAVDSELGRGSTFRVYLPGAAGAPAPTPEVAVHLAAAGTEHVLVVEDERAVRFLVRTILSRAGYQVFEAANPSEAEAFLGQRREPLHLLISDVVMPGGSGPAFFARIQPQWPDLRVLFMSGYTGEVVDREQLGDLSSALLQKPFTSQQLTQKVREVLDR